MNRYFSKIINFIPPEIAHFLFLELMKLELLEKKFYSERLSLKIWNINFNNPIGLAAGFDKNAEAISGLFKLGFGYLELGTVTRNKQLGNPKPRIFRIPEFKCIIQRLGFNNKGLENFLTNIKTLENRQNKVLGINIGKNSNSQDYVADYRELIKACSPYANYIVINISSPNTPGLRIFGFPVKSITVDSIPILDFPPSIIIFIFFPKSSNTSIALTGLSLVEIFALGMASGKLEYFSTDLTIL